MMSVILDELRLLILVDNETDTLSSVDEGVPQTPELVHASARVPISAHHEGHACKVVFDRLCCAGHGLSVLVTGKRGDEEHTVLFDAGPYSDLWLENADRLGVDLARIEAVFLSHWHSDHSGALPAAIRAICDARARRGLLAPLLVDVHPDRPDQRGLLHPSGTMLMLPAEPTFDELAPAGAEVVRHTEPHTLLNGFFFGSGAIERLTEYETGLASHYTFRGGRAQPDPLILDERYLAAQVKGRGVTVLSACSHAGVVNACLAAGRAFSGAAIDVVLGGYHLSGKAMEPRIGPTVRDLQERIRPRLVAPGHCTGWRAKAALARAFAPGRYGPSVVGSLYRLTSAD